jgi:glyoxylase-like metal-dependent hydrolase (beta-lactamase superfamily II)
MSQSYVRLDHQYQGFPHGIASYVLSDGTLVEAGPASTTPALLAGIRAAGYDPLRITRLFVTHIHLDHAGAAGVLLTRHLPNAQVFVHPKGAKHLIDPSKLVASAERLYGDRMGELWGEILPVPADRVVVIEDGETIGSLRAIDTPGHAVHHHAYYEASSGTLFTGDVGGVRMPDSRYVRPPTPPPELDLDAWAVSVARLRQLAPRRLCLTHFGEFDDVAWHFDDLMSRLDRWRDWLSADLSVEALRQREAGLLTPELAARFERVGNYSMCVEGFARYFAKRAAA